MSTEVNEVVEETQEAITSAESEQQVQDDRQKETQAAEQRKRNDAEYNWAEMRRIERELKQQNEDLRKQLSQVNKPLQAEEDDLGVKDEDLVEGKHLKNLYKEIKHLKSELKQRESTSVEDRLKLHYPDYAEVLANENIELINKTDPEFAETLALQQDPYKRVVAAYKFLKRLGIQSNATETIEKKKAIENSQKPLSVQAVGKQSAVGNVGMFENNLTPEMKKQFWKDMQQAMKAG
jgi:hypothetical protein